MKDTRRKRKKQMKLFAKRVEKAFQKDIQQHKRALDAETVLFGTRFGILTDRT